MIRERDWERRGLLNQVSNEKPPVKNHDWSKCFKNTYLFHTNSFDKTKDSPYYTPKVATLSIPFIHFSKTFLGDPGAVGRGRVETKRDGIDGITCLLRIFSLLQCYSFSLTLRRGGHGDAKINSDMRSTERKPFSIISCLRVIRLCYISIFSKTSEIYQPRNYENNQEVSLHP